jgi:selenocysteine lyase/cysteine desulfurase
MYTRRDFVNFVSATVALGVTQSSVARQASSAANPLGVREDFPATREFAYLNTPYIGPSPQVVVDAVKSFLQAKAENPVQLGSMLSVAADVRRKFAALVNAEVGEIGLLSTTSEGENIITAALDLTAGDNVVIDDLHYDTTLILYNHLARTRGIELRIVKRVGGAARLEDFAEQVDARTRLISVSWVSHQNGYRHDLKALAKLAHTNDAYLYVDAIQGVGALALDVRQEGIDFFTSGTYKWLYAGFGVAPFFVRSELLDRIKLDRIGWRQVESEPTPGQHQFYQDARKFGYATPAFAAIYQLNAALDYLSNFEIQAIEKHGVSLATRLNQSLREQGFKVLTPASNRSTIVAFVHGIDIPRAKRSIADADIKVSFREHDSQIRAGAGMFNNDDDIDRLLAVTGGWR